jgi:hypothetical protein
MQFKTDDYVTDVKTGQAGMVIANDGKFVSVMMAGPEELVNRYFEGELAPLESPFAEATELAPQGDELPSLSVPAPVELSVRYAYAYGYLASRSESILSRLEACRMILGEETDQWLHDTLRALADEIKEARAHAEASLYS